MRLNYKFRIGRFQVSLVAGLVTKVQGVNSNLKDGQHIIMWEFDETDYDKVRQALFAAQTFNHLPDIYIAQSHPGGGYHAYCFRAMSFIESLNIVSGTALVDPNYITMCAMRQHWTLRLTDKGQGQPEYKETLYGYGEPRIGYDDLVGVVEYHAYQKSLGNAPVE